jgi:uncharacterized UBP type Zn finger protein
MSPCSHLDQIRSVSPRTPEGCEECLKTGSYWVHLRLCLECGHVGCCDQSPGKHATKHFHRTSHPIMRSFEPGESWGWCYVDDVLLDDVDQWIPHRRARTTL